MTLTSIGLGIVLFALLLIALQSIKRDKPTRDDLQVAIQRAIDEKEAEISKIERVIWELQQEDHS